MKKLVSSVIKDFQNNIEDDNFNYIEDIFSYFYKNFKFMPITNITEDYINKYLFMWLPKKLSNYENAIIEKYVKVVNLFLKYIKNEYNIDIKEKCECDVLEIKRIVQANKEFKRFLNNPIISYEPLIIDFEAYKKRKSRLNNKNVFNTLEKSYYTLEEIFACEYLILKKMYTGRFIKISVDKNILKNVKKNDILYASIRQTPFFSWEFVDIYKYYSGNVIDYIKKEVYK